jgi:hypothetical protein
VGYFKDEHMIFTCTNKIKLYDLRDIILDAMIKKFAEYDDSIPDYSQYVSPVMKCLGNSLCALFVPADGSKEGWTTSNAMDEVREKVRAWIINNNAKNDDKIEYILVTDCEYKGVSAEKMVGE